MAALFNVLQVITLKIIYYIDMNVYMDGWMDGWMDVCM